ncbi:fimbrillin family protein [Bacteroides faecium]|uniref:Fimbrillin family protein n=1 Tax=Bacteroides faecium TaxID=2715212 RepID=A0A6H0KK86_9BACE|nr:fimbrillin family protein [Bacteroides faecium]QIU93705.1 fimbrillin family protein [Bacteroides faecium]
MKKIFYILALGIGLAGCSNNEDESLSTGTFPGERVISVITEVNEPLSRAGFDATNLERFGLMIRNSENAAYNYHKQMVGSGNIWSTSDGQQMLWDAERTPVMMIAYAPYASEASPDAPLAVNALTNQATGENVMASDFLLMKATVDPEKDLTADGKLKISLNHAMSKLIIKLTVNGTADADMGKLGDMAVNGAVVNGICDLSAAAPVVVPAADAAVATVAPYKGTEYCECILPPQTVTEGFSINFSYDGKLYIWTAKAAVELEKGVEHTLTLNVNTTARLAAMVARNRATGQLIDRN